MKTLEQIQEGNRKAIILANNPVAKDYDEALEMELNFGCVVMDILHQFFGKSDPTPMELIYDTGDDSYHFTHYRANPVIKFEKGEIIDRKRFKIIGKPLTLDRVLIALGVGFETKTFQDRSPDKDMYLYIFNKSDRMLWDLSKKTLERQGEGTQRAINKLLIK
tara:strand:+ start:138 stop:626 length:489 start_codon:yes stop_codon:yes gene_type:complete